MIKERVYQKVDYKGLQKCVRWCQNYLNLRDWQIELYEGINDRSDRTVGWTIINPEKGDEWHEKAEMWVDLDWCEKRQCNPYVTVCHEMIHVLVMGKCRINDPTDNDEIISYAMQDLLYQAFCKANEIKIVPMEEE